MIYTTLIVNEKEYKLRLNAQNSVELEKKLGKNPLNVLMEMDEDKLPSIETLVYILFYSLQAFNHGMSLEKTYELYDELVDSGKTLEDILPLILDIFKVSGFIKDNNKDSDKESDSEVKN